MVAALAHRIPSDSSLPHLHVAPCLAHHPYGWALHLFPLQSSHEQRLWSTGTNLQECAVYE